MAGVPIDRIADYFGHSTIRLTMICARCRPHDDFDALLVERARAIASGSIHPPRLRRPPSRSHSQLPRAPGVAPQTKELFIWQLCGATDASSDSPLSADVRFRLLDGIGAAPERVATERR